MRKVVTNLKKYECRTQVSARQGDYHDGEVTGPGRTIQSDYEPMQDLIRRVLSGQVRNIPTGEYDVDDSMSDDQAFELEDVTQADGFDLADTDEIFDHLNEASKRASGYPIKQANERASEVKEEENQEKGADE